MSYTFDYYNGNVGDREVYETKEEAVRAAESYWNHLTPKERADHGSEHGGWCMVYEGDDDTALVWFRDLDEEAQGWTFDDCMVEVDDSRLKVCMERDGERRVQTVPGFDLDRDIVSLNMGSSPVGDQWEDGNGNLVCWENADPCDQDGDPMDRIILDVDDRLVAITVPHFENDVWEAIDRYDDEHGTDLWSKLTEGDVVGVNLPEYADVPEADPSELPQRAREVTADMRIGVSGHSLILKITEQAKMLGVGRGDIVSVTIRRKD